MKILLQKILTKTALVATDNHIITMYLKNICDTYLAGINLFKVFTVTLYVYSNFNGSATTLLSGRYIEPFHPKNIHDSPQNLNSLFKMQRVKALWLGWEGSQLQPR